MSASKNQYNTPYQYNQEEIEFAHDGWPINPETGETFSRDEIVTNRTIPYPLDVDTDSDYWSRRSPAALAKQKAEVAKKAKARNRANARRKSSRKPAVPYTAFETSASRQRDKSYLSTAELVDRVNGKDKPGRADNEILFTAHGNTRTLVVHR